MGKNSRIEWTHHTFTVMLRVGKKAAGRQLDGAMWDGLPKALAATRIASQQKAEDQCLGEG
jgi:hypothetical protein